MTFLSSKRHFYIFVLSLSVALAFFACLLSADETNIPVEERQLTTPHYKYNPKTFKPRLGEYVYNVTWQGIPGATAWGTLESYSKGLYKLTIDARTVRAVDIFYRLRYHAELIFSKTTMLPLHVIINKKENSRIRNYDMTFSSNGDISVVREKNDGKEKIKFNTHNFTLDPFSAAFMARGLDWEKLNETKIFDAYEGKSRYKVELTSVANKDLEWHDKNYKTWEIKPRTTKIGSEHKKNKLRDASIYITADRRRDLLLVVSEVFIGSVKIRLGSYTPIKEVYKRREAEKARQEEKKRQHRR